jgi:hypothetical protein
MPIFGIIAGPEPRDETQLGDLPTTLHQIEAVGEGGEAAALPTEDGDVRSV